MLAGLLFVWTGRSIGELIAGNLAGGFLAVDVDGQAGFADGFDHLVVRNAAYMVRREPDAAGAGIVINGLEQRSVLCQTGHLFFCVKQLTYMNIIPYLRIYVNSNKIDTYLFFA